MPSVVIIHAAEDALPARALADKLRAARLTPVIEQPLGEDLRAAVRSAAVTLALWSPRSASQQALFDEVTFAKSKGKVIHARMQNTATPEQFRNDKSIDLTGWRGEDDFPAWRELAKLVTQQAGVPPPPPPGPKGPQGFFTPGMSPSSEYAQANRAGAKPQQRPAQRPAQQSQRTQSPRQQPQRAAAPRAAQGEAKSGGGLPIVPIIIGALLIAGGVGGYFVWNNMQGSNTTANAWESVPRNDASALRAFIDGDPGQYREEAQQALAALEEQTFDAAREEDTIPAFENFLNDFPESEHAIEARGRIAELQSMPAVEETPIEPLPGDLTNPDLLPPDASTGVLPDAGGPAPLTPAPTPAPPEPPPNDQPLPSN